MGPTEPMHVSRIRGNTPIEVPDWGGEKKGRNGRKEESKETDKKRGERREKRRRKIPHPVMDHVGSSAQMHIMVSNMHKYAPLAARMVLSQH